MERSPIQHKAHTLKTKGNLKSTINLPFTFWTGWTTSRLLHAWSNILQLYNFRSDQIWPFLLYYSITKDALKHLHTWNSGSTSASVQYQHLSCEFPLHVYPLICETWGNRLLSSTHAADERMMFGNTIAIYSQLKCQQHNAPTYQHWPHWEYNKTATFKKQCQRISSNLVALVKLNGCLWSHLFLCHGKYHSMTGL